MPDSLNFYSLEENLKVLMLEATVNRGKIIRKMEGMCGEIYIFDQGDQVTPRYICAKVPKPLRGTSPEEVSNRFVHEMEKQLSFYHHKFVNWAFDFISVFNAPVALFRYWGSDLERLIESNSSGLIENLSIMIYISEGLQHCYDNGLITHQDLKPQNIFIRDLKQDFVNLPNLDIYTLPMVADFGLSNAFIDSNLYEGSRPYMAPEQWNKTNLSPSTDIFALGVIFYQMLTKGLHPAGIKLNDYWPSPLKGNTQKWTRESSWKNWSRKGAKIENIDIIESFSPALSNLISQMLMVSPTDRPNLQEVNSKLLDHLKDIDIESYTQLKVLLKAFRNESTKKPLSTTWPYLSSQWKSFKDKFGN